MCVCRLSVGHRGRWGGGREVPGGRWRAVVYSVDSCALCSHISLHRLEVGLPPAPGVCCPGVLPPVLFLCSYVSSAFLRRVWTPLPRTPAGTVEPRRGVELQGRGPCHPGAQPGVPTLCPHQAQPLARQGALVPAEHAHEGTRRPGCPGAGRSEETRTRTGGHSLDPSDLEADRHRDCSQVTPPSETPSAGRCPGPGITGAGASELCSRGGWWSVLGLWDRAVPRGTWCWVTLQSPPLALVTQPSPGGCPPPRSEPRKWGY